MVNKCAAYGCKSGFKVGKGMNAAILPRLLEIKRFHSIRCVRILARTTCRRITPRSEKLTFLREFADFVWRWEQSKKPGLTRETFLALRHTCLALAATAPRISSRSDIQIRSARAFAVRRHWVAIWLAATAARRQLLHFSQTGAREWQENSRRISSEIFQDFTWRDRRMYAGSKQRVAAGSSSSDSSRQRCRLDHWRTHFPTIPDSQWLQHHLLCQRLHSTVNNHDEMKCEHCKESLITTDPLEPIEIDGILDYTAATFTDTINRGGLARPTDYAFLLAVHCWRVFDEIKATAGLMSPFLAAASHRILFCKIMERAACMQTFGHQPIDSNYCFNGHDLNQLIVTRFFNCVAKNLVKDITNKANTTSTDNADKRKRKVAKLSGATAATQQH